ncbi:MAG: hypothetical protein WB624_12025 [Xanthobacteraceae bacterium]
MHDRSQSPIPIRGRPFVKGNSGRPPGSQNRATRVASTLLAGDAEALIRKGIKLALSGDVGVLKFLLSRILPRERPITVEIPNLVFADDAVAATAAVMREVAEGRITPAEGAALATIIKANRDAIDLADVVKRIDQLEARRGN